ncbi:Dihydrodipicolinate synthase [Tieghemiomyces parasiticus]|uniref:Dihydrodipicolinate synthase n=1 Tax=Tieghemiomyces parasiticus TaxID=78921 RepID=A0A9W8AL89_9FUNG|nr:Dihydrodipicolinate synthase [Tieghemiomyces parasiticus]
MIQEVFGRFLHDFKDNPINWVLAAALIYMVQAILFPSVRGAPATETGTAPETSDTRAADQASSSKKASPAASSSVTPASRDKIKHPETVVFKEYTMRELLPYNGADGSPNGKIYMAVSGKVFDVSRGANFYGPQGPYGNFAGQDASRGLAKGTFEKDILPDVGKPIDTLEDLNAEERDALKDWESLFVSKYPQVGVLVNEKDA